MKKRARKIQVWLACVFAVILLWNLGQVEAKASTAQEDNLVIIYSTPDDITIYKNETKEVEISSYVYGNHKSYDCFLLGTL